MLRSMCLVALVAVADGLRAGAPLGRRAAVTGAVGALVSWRAPAEAKELSSEERAGILSRAQSNTLKTDLAVGRAREGTLFDGKDASCTDLSRIIELDIKAGREQLKAYKDAKEDVEVQKKSGSAEAILLAETRLEEVKAINSRLDKAVSNLQLDQAQRCGLM